MSASQYRTSKLPQTAGEQGHSVIEFTLLSPWILLLFMGIFNLGFYCYGLIAVENAARVAAIRLSADGQAAVSQEVACDYVRNEMRMISNSGFGGPDVDCQNAPLIVNAELVAADDARNPDAVWPTALVTVTYESIPLFPIPGLTGRLSVTRMAQMRRS